MGKAHEPAYNMHLSTLRWVQLMIDPLRSTNFFGTNKDVFLIKEFFGVIFLYNTGVSLIYFLVQLARTNFVDES